MLALSVFWKTLPVVVIVVVVCLWAIRRFGLPFVPGVYFKVLAVVAVLAGIAWWLVFKLTDYEVMPADYGGTIISSLILSYLIHLWIIPIDDGFPEEFVDASDDGTGASSSADLESEPRPPV